MSLDWLGDVLQKDADDRDRHKRWYSLSDEQKDTIEKLLESGALDSYFNPWTDLNQQILTIPIESNKSIKIVVENPQDDIPEACRHCSNHPSNGGSGVCLCTLGGPKITYS